MNRARVFTVASVVGDERARPGYERAPVAVLHLPAIVIFPSPCVNIFSPPKQASKQGDSLSGALLFIHRRHRLGGLGGRWILRRQLRNRNAVNGQQPPQASILFAEPECFLLWRLEWKGL
jgi:hypothetical protein